jgi:hypothetical protein
MKTHMEGKIKTGVYEYPKSGRRIRIKFVSAPEDNNGAPGISVKRIGERSRSGFYVGIWTYQHMRDAWYLGDLKFVRPLGPKGW